MRVYVRARGLVGVCKAGVQGDARSFLVGDVGLLAGGVAGGEEGRENAKKRNVHKEEGARGWVVARGKKTR